MNVHDTTGIPDLYRVFWEVTNSNHTKNLSRHQPALDLCRGDSLDM